MPRKPKSQEQGAEINDVDVSRIGKLPRRKRKGKRKKASFQVMPYFKNRKIRDQQKRQKIDEYYNAKKCEKCGLGHKDRNIVLCDKCDDAYHTFCLEPPLLRRPKKYWLCPECQKAESEQVQPQNLDLRKIDCVNCDKPLSKGLMIKYADQQHATHMIKSETLSVPQRCLKCQRPFHSGCMNPRHNSVNCQGCEKQIRATMPKGHNEWVKFIRQSHKKVRETGQFDFLQDNPQPTKTETLRLLRLKVAPYLTSWQSIVQYEASVYYAFATRGVTFVDDQLYRRDSDGLELNKPIGDINGSIPCLHPKDQQAFEEFKKKSREGYAGPLEVKQDCLKGFYIVATDYIEPYTIISEYVGEVMTSRHSLRQQSDSTFLLMRGRNADSSLDIVPYRYSNISRFFAGINNSDRRFRSLENIKTIRFNYKGRVRVLMYTSKGVQAGETLYLDYNGSHMHEYPTEHFVL